MSFRASGTGVYVADGWETGYHFSQFNVEMSASSATAFSAGQLAAGAFSANQGGTVTQVRSGPMFVAPGALYGTVPYAFNYVIYFTTPYVYTGGTDIVITVHHTGTGWTSSPSLDAQLDAVSVSSAIYATTFAATGGASGTWVETTQLLTSGGPPAGPRIELARGVELMGPGRANNVGAGFSVGVPTPLTYTVWNSGLAALAPGNPATLSNFVNCAATLTQSPSASILPQASSNTILTVTPSANGVFSFDYSLASNDADPGRNPFLLRITGVASTTVPDMQAQRGALLRADGSTDSLGPAFTAATANPLTYTFLNIGSAALLLPGAASIGSLVNCSVTITTAPAGSVAPTASTTTTLSITPTASGLFSFTYSIANNDPGSGKNPYNLSITGFASVSARSEIDVGRTWPVAVGSTDDLGASFVAGQYSNAVSWRIENNGTADLNISTGSYINSMANCTVNVSPGPALVVAAGTSTSLQLYVYPLSAGAFSFSVSIPNDDSNENPYVWNVIGSAGQANMSVTRSSIVVADGGSDVLGGGFTAGIGTTVKYQITNSGGALTMSSPIYSNLVNCTCSTLIGTAGTIQPGGSPANFWVTVTPSVSGNFSFDVSISNNDPGAGKNPYNWTVSGSAAAPDMDVKRGATSIASGSTDNVGGAFTVGVGSALTYTISNFGFANLALGNPASISNLTNCTCTIITTPAASVAFSASTTMILTVTPTLPGAFSFTCSLINNDTGAGKNPYTWTVAGSSPIPDMTVTRGAAAVPDGSTDAVGSLFVAGTPGNLTYTISNTGTGSLTLGIPGAIGAQSNCSVNITTPPAPTVAPAGTTGLVLTVTVTVPGAFSFTYSLASNDPAKNPYNWTVSGTATAAPAPEIDVFRALAPIAVGSTDSVGAAFTFGIAATITYTLANTGSANLNIIALPVAAPGALSNCSASITTQPTSPIAASAATTLVVSITPLAAGAFSCTISIDNDDSNENPYSWIISGNASAPPAPEIDVSRGLTPIVDGSIDSVGNPAVGAPLSLTYVIANTGTASLTLSSVPAVSVSGLVNCTVNIVVAPPASVAASGSANFTVEITPTSAGAFSAVLNIANNDANENPYDWTISGTATSSGGGGGSGGGGAGGGCSTEDQSAPIMLLMAKLALLLLVGKRTRLFRRS